MEDSQICAYAGTGGETRDVCNGDSGGPLLIPGTNKQIAIMSFSHKCGDPIWPAVFTMPITSEHMRFITGTVSCLARTEASHVYDDACCPYDEFSDGVIKTEECDDGNDRPGDGCYCGRLQSGYLCAGQPSDCVRCGTTVNDRCVDQNAARDLCGEWVASGQCTSSDASIISAVHQLCPASCGICTPAPITRELEIHIMLGPGQILDDFSWKITSVDESEHMRNGKHL